MRSSVDGVTRLGSTGPTTAQTSDSTSVGFSLRSPRDVVWRSSTSSVSTSRMNRC
ncbi:hypothetical protein JG688_00001495 [Phytophthora aleatoria]|uniref:Uncharacterized protein n=1 Tax=Phytophthora aleatoria TaxID=2496075 RepID=A0A8J5IXN3_9STRA|nr:hypothetical protein JG688_00001495 [Phytophthora aleatoria]